MRFMMIMHPTPDAENGVVPPPEAFAAMMKYNEELQKAGVLLALDGLQPSVKGARIRFDGGQRTVSDGPFTESKEIIGGYWVIQCKSKAEAIEWAKRCPANDGDMIEVRQVFEMTEFSPEIQHATKDSVDALSKQLSQKGA